MKNKIITTIDEKSTLVEKIKNWNQKNISDLQEWLLDLDELCCADPDGDRLEELVDLSELPSSGNFDKPDNNIDLSSYPVWAIDDDGYCLVGDDAFDYRLRYQDDNCVEHITHIIEDPDD